METIIYLKECSSTNDEIISVLTSEIHPANAIYTFNQTKGKGQYGNRWESSVDENIALSIALPSSQFEIRDELFNFHTALLLADFLAIMTKTHPEIKWPNDLMIRNKKVSGILIEKKNINGISYLIIGIGLNVLQKNFKNLPKAGSLFTQTGIAFPLHDLVTSLYAYLTEHLHEKISEEELIKRLNLRLFKKDQVSVFEIEGIRQNGIVRSVDQEGFLWVELEDEHLRKFYHKEIEFLY